MPPYDPRLPIPMLEDDGMAYLRHWTALLSLELTSLQAAATQQKLFEISVEKYEPTNNLATPRHRRKTWKVLIPGIREDTPRIQTGDILVLRGLYPELKTADKRAIQARIAGHVKRDGVVFVESPEMESHANFLPRDEKGQVRWVVEFKASSEATCIMHNAVSSPSTAGYHCAYFPSIARLEVLQGITKLLNVNLHPRSRREPFPNAGFFPNFKISLTLPRQ